MAPGVIQFDAATVDFGVEDADADSDAEGDAEGGIEEDISTALDVCEDRYSRTLTHTDS